MGGENYYFHLGKKVENVRQCRNDHGDSEWRFSDGEYWITSFTIGIVIPEIDITSGGGTKSLNCKSSGL
jgi:hypothetical protein